jgi:hypothetical protein
MKMKLKLVINNVNDAMRVESRTTSYNPLGKCDEAIKAKIPHQIKEEILKRARACGMNESEFLRMVLMLYIYGEDHVLSLERKKIEMVARKAS